MIRPRHLVALLVLAFSLPAFGAVRAWLDVNRVAPGDTLQLTLEDSSQTNTQPDLTPLQRDFDVLGTSTSRSVQITNGNTSATTQFIVTLSPKATGHLKIPALSWGAGRTPELPLEVSAAAGSAADATRSGSPKTFLETQVDRPDPYVQAGVGITVRVYSIQPLQQVNLTLPQPADALIAQVGADSSGTAAKNGQQYQVITRHYMLFPQRSGSLHLDGVTLDAQIIAAPSRTSPLGRDPFGAFFDNSPFNTLFRAHKPLRLHGDPIQLAVRPRPPGSTGTWIPSPEVQLSARWTPDSSPVHAGDPVTLELRLSAKNLTAEQLPDLASLLRLPDGIKSYADQPKFENTVQGDTLLGTRRQSIALIADAAGHFAIPPVDIRWWDTTTDRARDLTIPGRSLSVLPPAGAPPAAAAKRPDQGAAGSDSAPSTAAPPARTVQPSTHSLSTPGAWVTPLWRSLTVVGWALWLVTVCLWIYSHRRKLKQRDPADAARPETSPDESAARAAFGSACTRNDPAAARRHLLEWLAAVRDRAPGRPSLNELARASDDPHLTLLLRELDRACFTGCGWNGQPLSQALRELPRRGPVPRKRAVALRPLYPVLAAVVIAGATWLAAPNPDGRSDATMPPPRVLPPAPEGPMRATHDSHSSCRPDPSLPPPGLAGALTPADSV